MLLSNPGNTLYLLGNQKQSYNFLPLCFLQALTDIAKKRQRMGLLSALSDNAIQSYQSQSSGRTATDKHQNQTTVSPKLYETNIVIDESGRRVKETAV